MNNKQLWYTRRDMEIRGPFPAGLVTRYILLGRIQETDQLSTDQVSWHPVSELPELIPDELKLDLSKPENREKLRRAQLREDERGAVDWRLASKAGTDVYGNLPERTRERRRSEPMDVLRHREIKTQLLSSLRQKQKQHYVPRILGLVSLLSAIIALVWWYG
ncbi:MAG: hypothetical protein PVJ39_14885 [Gammaproteobacteria bacterium]|jgi:hypothetical protein